MDANGMITFVIELKIQRIMFSDKDFEKLWFLYKTEGEPHGTSINSFCMNQGVPYTQFNTWYRTRMQKIVPVEVEGMPEGQGVTPEEQSSPHVTKTKELKQLHGQIMVTIQTREGLYLRKSNLNYAGLKAFVEKMEGLC